LHVVLKRPDGVQSLTASGIAKGKAVLGLTDHRINAYTQNDEISAVVKGGSEWSAACSIQLCIQEKRPQHPLDRKQSVP
jgi:hypothetical protein